MRYIRVSLEPLSQQSSLGYGCPFVAMSTPNGLPRTTTPTRPTTPSQITGKRKRAESTDETLENGGDHNNAETAEPTPGNFHELLVDILEVLQKFASPA